MEMGIWPLGVAVLLSNLQLLAYGRDSLVILLNKCEVPLAALQPLAFPTALFLEVALLLSVVLLVRK